MPSWVKVLFLDKRLRNGSERQPLCWSPQASPSSQQHSPTTHSHSTLHTKTASSHPLSHLLGTHTPHQQILWAPSTISSVQVSCSVVSDSLQPHGLQHARLPCPSPTPGACSNSCPLSQCCHPTISSFVVPFSCLQSFPASGQFFTSGG